MLENLDARGEHLFYRSFAVAGLEIDRSRRVEEYRGREARSGGVESRRLDAVVEGQPDDDDALDRVAAEQLGQPGRRSLAGLGVAGGEARVSVRLARAFSDRHSYDIESRVELGSPFASDTVDRPEPAVLVEVRRRFGMPILGVDDARARSPSVRDLPIDGADHPLAAGDVQVSARIGEVVLDIDDNQRGSLIVEGRVSEHQLPPR